MSLNPCCQCLYELHAQLPIALRKQRFSAGESGIQYKPKDICECMRSGMYMMAGCGVTMEVEEWVNMTV